MKTLAFLILLAVCAGAQQRTKLTINSETEEGKLLQEIEQQSDPAKKQPLLEQFVAKYPKHEGAAWVYGQVQAIYLTQNQFDQSLDAGAKALALDPGNLDAAYNNLKAAEGKKDTVLIKSWAMQTSQIARGAASSVGASDPEAAKRTAYAKQVGVYSEYSLYAAALQSNDAAMTIDLVESLEELNAESQYLSKAYPSYLNALRQSGQADKAEAAAERLADRDLANEDVLLMAADYNLQKKNQPDKVILYATKLVSVLNKKTKPEGLTGTDWEKKKQSMSGLANWMAGITYSGQGKFAEADKSLRAALPNLKDEQVRAIGLFHLGLADYQLGKAGKNRGYIQDALFFSEKSAAIKSPLQIQAQKNVRALRGELGSR